MESISRFITQKLNLKVNEAKSAVARPQERKFLGFSFTAGPDIKRTIAPKSLDRFKQRIRDITRRAKGVSIETTGSGPLAMPVIAALLGALFPGRILSLVVNEVELLGAGPDDAEAQARQAGRQDTAPMTLLK
jgi:hypothetical protein